MPVATVLLWATLLTLGWRAAHGKDGVPPTPRVQLSFKGKPWGPGQGGRGARHPLSRIGSPLGSAALWGAQP